MTTTGAPVSCRDEDVTVTVDGVPVRHKGLVLVVCWDGAIFLGRRRPARRLLVTQGSSDL